MTKPNLMMTAVSLLMTAGVASAEHTVYVELTAESIAAAEARLGAAARDLVQDPQMIAEAIPLSAAQTDLELPPGSRVVMPDLGDRVSLAPAFAAAEAAAEADGRPFFRTDRAIYVDGLTLDDARALVARLSADPDTAFAAVVPTIAPPPTPDFSGSQGYLDVFPGINMRPLHDLNGGRGENVTVIDLEYSFNPNHEDLPPVAQITDAWFNGFGDDHGTAVLGIVGALDNGIGMTGGVPDATLMFEGTVSLSGVYDVGAAILRSVNALEAGDTILIEQQIGGPNVANDGTQNGLVPVSWFGPWHSAIEVAIANGIMVVEAAGNGAEDLDDPVYNTGHQPFTPAGDHGGITVGAGSNFSVSRLSFSNFGTSIDLQGWGTGVATLGYGGLFSSEGKNAWYTGSFGGTSSASPTVVNPIAALQSIAIATNGAPLDPAVLRQALIDTGVPGVPGQRIGPRPDPVAALGVLFPGPDCDASGIPDHLEIDAGLLPDANFDGVPDTCAPFCPGDTGRDGVVNTADLLVLLANFGQPTAVGAAAGDFDGSGTVNTADLLFLLSAFGSSCN